MGFETHSENAIELRIRLLRDLERSVAEQPGASVPLLAAIRERLQEAEAELARER